MIHERDEADQRVVDQVFEETGRAMVGHFAAVVKLVVDPGRGIHLRACYCVERGTKDVGAETVAAQIPDAERIEDCGDAAGGEHCIMAGNRGSSRPHGLRTRAQMPFEGVGVDLDESRDHVVALPSMAPAIEGPALGDLGR